MAKIHIGKKIKEIVDKSAFTVVEFAKAINLSRDGVYKIFAKEYIDTDQLKKISEILRHDFFNYYSTELGELKDPSNQFGYATKDDLEQLKRLIEVLAKKIDERFPQKKEKAKKNYSKK